MGDKYTMIKCEKINCNRLATHKIRYTYHDRECMYYICDECAEKILLSGLSYRKETKFKLISYVELEENIHD